MSVRDTQINLLVVQLKFCYITLEQFSHNLTDKDIDKINKSIKSIKKIIASHVTSPLIRSDE